MSDKPFLPQYSGEAIGDLLELEPRYRIDSLVSAVEQALWAKRERSGDQSLSEAEFTVLSIESLEREVNNGGYGQFFSNSSNEFVRRIVGDLKQIGCDGTAALTEQAIAALDLSELDPDAIENRVLMDDDQLEEALESLDVSYYSLAEDTACKLFTFVQQNKEKFSIP